MKLLTSSKYLLLMLLLLATLPAVIAQSNIGLYLINESQPYCSFKVFNIMLTNTGNTTETYKIDSGGTATTPIVTLNASQSQMIYLFLSDETGYLRITSLGKGYTSTMPVSKRVCTDFDYTLSEEVCSGEKLKLTITNFLGKKREFTVDLGGEVVKKNVTKEDSVSFNFDKAPGTYKLRAEVDAVPKTFIVRVNKCTGFSIILENYSDALACETRTYPVTIKNFEPARQINLSLDGPSWGQLSTSSVNLLESSEYVANLVVSPPCNVSGKYYFNIIGQSDIRKEARFSVQSKAVEELLRTRAGSVFNLFPTQKYTFKLENTGFEDDEFTVYITGPDFIRFTPQDISLRKGEIKEFTADITKVQGNESSFTITARSRATSYQYDREVKILFTRLQPEHFGYALIALLIVVIVLAVILKEPKPEDKDVSDRLIEKLYSEPRSKWLACLTVIFLIIFISYFLLAFVIPLTADTTATEINLGFLSLILPYKFYILAALVILAAIIYILRRRERAA